VVGPETFLGRIIRPLEWPLVSILIGDVMEQGRANAFSLPTLNRAKKALGIKVTAVHVKGKMGVQKWMWAL
jgi:hypothetical protein